LHTRWVSLESVNHPPGGVVILRANNADALVFAVVLPEGYGMGVAVEVNTVTTCLKVSLKLWVMSQP
jgi:hypothetical protein